LNRNESGRFGALKSDCTKVAPNKMMLGREITPPVQAFISKPEKDNREISTTEYIENLQQILNKGNNTEYGTALTTILPILFLYLNTVTVTAETFEP
jgi:hypothetical protein